MLANPTPAPVACRGIALAEAAAFFQSNASSSERALFPAGMDDLCDRGFGIFSGNSLIGVATTRGCGTYWKKLQSELDRCGRETLLTSLRRISIYDPAHLAPLPEVSLRQVFKQIAWVAVGGDRGWTGKPAGTELFGRFVAERFRGRGYGMQLLDHVLAALESENQLPLRAMPSSKSDRSYGGRADGKRMIVLNSAYFQSKLSR
jgi:GNAT superfamily N-acetyltransferase